jgi:hypothetical protein
MTTLFLQFQPIAIAYYGTNKKKGSQKDGMAYAFYLVDNN